MYIITRFFFSEVGIGGSSYFLQPNDQSRIIDLVLNLSVFFAAVMPLLVDKNYTLVIHLLAFKQNKYITEMRLRTGIWASTNTLKK